MTHKPLYSYNINQNIVLNGIHGYCETDFLDVIVEHISYSCKQKFQFLYNIWKYPLPVLERPTIVFMTSYEEGLPTPQEYIDNPNITHIFRHYYSKETSKKVHHIPLGYVQGFEQIKTFSLNSRPIDYFFSGTMNQHDRPEMITVLRQYSKQNPRGLINITPGWKTGFSERNHGILLQQSKIALVPNGFTSSESFRFFEAAYAGCIIICLEKPPAWYYDKSPHFTIKNWSEAPELIEKLLENIKDEKMENELSSQISSYSNYVISPNSVAKFVMEKLNAQ